MVSGTGSTSRLWVQHVKPFQKHAWSGRHKQVSTVNRQADFTGCRMATRVAPRLPPNPRVPWHPRSLQLGLMPGNPICVYHQPQHLGR